VSSHDVELFLDESILIMSIGGDKMAFGGISATGSSDCSFSASSLSSWPRRLFNFSPKRQNIIRHQDQHSKFESELTISLLSDNILLSPLLGIPTNRLSLGRRRIVLDGVVVAFWRAW
jgi:hypothetical protein